MTTVDKPRGLAWHLAWFLHRSWRHLGSASGAGRWRARRRYLFGLWPAWRRFWASVKADREVTAR